jgi:phosphoadenosine phosphosulfate reductase
MLPLDECEKYLDHHKGGALQLSGGKDSMAMLFHLRPLWGKLTVYWSNPGNPPKESVELMGRVRALVPNFVEITSDVLTDIAHNGFPSDIVPVTLTRFAELGSGIRPPYYIRPTMNCCYMNMYKPLHDRMILDAHTLIIRGEKEADTERNHMLTDGMVVEGIQYLFPIYDETSESVMAYLKEHAPDFIHPAYSYGSHGGPECDGCTGWLDENLGEYMKNSNPESYALRQKILATVADHSIAIVKLMG